LDVSNIIGELYYFTMAPLALFDLILLPSTATEILGAVYTGSHAGKSR